MFVSCSMWEPVCYVTTACGGRGECVKGRRFAVRAAKLWSNSPEEIRSAESGAGFPLQIRAELKRYLRQKTHFKKHVLSFATFISIAPSSWRSRLKIPPPTPCPHIPCHVLWLFDVRHVTCEYGKKCFQSCFVKKNPFHLKCQTFFSVYESFIEIDVFPLVFFSICSFTFVQFQYWWKGT